MVEEKVKCAAEKYFRDRAVSSLVRSVPDPGVQNKKGEEPPKEPQEPPEELKRLVKELSGLLDGILTGDSDKRLRTAEAHTGRGRSVCERGQRVVLLSG